MGSSETQSGDGDRSSPATSAGDGHPPLSRGRKAAFACVLLLLLGGIAEIVGQIVYARRSPADRYLKQAYFQNREWAADLLTVQESLTLRYEPYVGWRRTDCRSRFLNVIDGERVTVHPGEPGPEAVNVWCFGGSTMWGEGVRDAFTIPSHLARIAQEAGFDVHVRNLGESGWVSTQEAMYCALKVRSGEVPDIAVFYDGVNDVFSAYQTGRTDGGPQNRDIFENYFNRGYDPRRRFRNKIAIYRALRRISLEFSDEWTPAVGTTVPVDRAAEELVTTYARTVDFSRRLGRSYRFDTFFFWQPVIAFQPDYKNTERDAYVRGSSRGLDGMLDFYREVTQRVRAEDVIDLSECLGPSPPQGYFIDHNHLNEEGNAEVAEAIFQHLRPLLAKGRAGDRG